ncbi:hypothetical protein [Janibacter melonis]|uniref:hypothetical protein n=1 Tax=Janibacter melonis TaxID=262209 RepID=UPI001E4B38C8|nr:hypothetical protein [Janibacter melonis]MCB5991198.1 hypothetical protein [Janibacter melonis]
MVRALVLPSPLLPALAYAELADALTRTGWSARVAAADLGEGEGAGDLVERWAGEVGLSDVLVAHSNAGYLAPLVRETTGLDVPLVAMDAALPPAEGRYALAPPALRDMLTALADADGLLPPWTHWWPSGALDDVVPADRLAELDAACPRLPVAYVDETFEAPKGWATRPSAFLAFGQTYTEEIEAARSWDWPVRVLEGAHLHHLHAPDEVAAAVVALAAPFVPAG